MHPISPRRFVAGLLKVDLLGIDVRVLWLHGLVLWMENEPVLDEDSQADVRAALGRLAPEEDDL